MSRDRYISRIYQILVQQKYTFREGVHQWSGRYERQGGRPVRSIEMPWVRFFVFRGFSLTYAEVLSLGRDCTVSKTSVLIRTIPNSLCVKWGTQASSRILDPQQRSEFLGLSIRYFPWSRALLGLLISCIACKDLNLEIPETRANMQKTW